MMLNKSPMSISLAEILEYLDRNERWGARNRALYAVRQQLRIKDIAPLTIGDLFHPDMIIRHTYVSSIDGARYELDVFTKTELQNYVLTLLDAEGQGFDDPDQIDFDIPIFPTNKRNSFSANTLAQHYSYLDKEISSHFTELASREPIIRPDTSVNYCTPIKHEPNTAKSTISSWFSSVTQRG
jgi:hypothetical protein